MRWIQPSFFKMKTHPRASTHSFPDREDLLKKCIQTPLMLTLTMAA